MSKHSDIIGKKYNRLTVLSILKKGNRGNWSVECICDCGTKITTLKHSLVFGNTNSCGCYRNDKMKEAWQLEIGQSSLNHLYKVYKRRAKLKGVSFILDLQEFKKLTKGNCYYCNIEPKQVINIKSCNGEYIYNGIDRVDNNIGYILSNCVSCCKICNRMKMEHNIKDFLNYIKNIYEFLQLGDSNE